MSRPEPQDRTPQVAESGRDEKGQPTSLDRRLFMQVLAFTGCEDTEPLISALEQTGIQGALYKDLHDPMGVALAVANEDPEFFVTDLRELLQDDPFNTLCLKPEYTMVGRTYSIGYETDLENVLVHRPLKRLLDPDLKWVVWYPLRRKGEFAQLDEKEQREALMEHGRIGNAFGEAGHAHDIRLACFGLDTNDNDFVIGLLGRELNPLSVIVQTMRKTKQTSKYIEKMGPFLVVRKIWSSGT